MNAIARELAWRRIIRRWQYLLKHLPAEQNDEADALSRLEAVPRRDLPDLGNAVFIKPPKQDDSLWKARLEFSQPETAQAKAQYKRAQQDSGRNAQSWNKGRTRKEKW